MAGGTVTAFADLGVMAYEDGVLPDALHELALRLDLSGAGELLTLITDQTCWGHIGELPCPRCGLKRDPTPHPKPPPDPKPEPKPGSGT